MHFAHNIRLQQIDVMPEPHTRSHLGCFDTPQKELS